MNAPQSVFPPPAVGAVGIFGDDDGYSVGVLADHRDEYVDVAGLQWDEYWTPEPFEEASARLFRWLVRPGEVRS